MERKQAIDRAKSGPSELVVLWPKFLPLSIEKGKIAQSNFTYLCSSFSFPTV